MRSYRQIVKDTQKLLESHRLGEMPEVLPLWRDVEWQETAREDDGADCVLSNADQPVIRLCPPLLQQQNPERAVLREFGNLILRKGGQRSATIWNKKLDLPTTDHIEAFVTRLGDLKIRQACQTYRDLLKHYPEKGSAVDRLVAVNFINGLLANNVAFPSSEGIDIRTFGATAQYASFKRYHHLIPLTSAYCPHEVHESFGIAFAEFILKDLKCCRESSVADGLRRIIVNVVSRLQPMPDITPQSS